jgi:hypothetical protein
LGRRAGAMNKLALDIYLDIQKDKLQELDRVNNKIYDILSTPLLKNTRATIFKGLEQVAIKYEQAILNQKVMA